MNVTNEKTFIELCAEVALGFDSGKPEIETGRVERHSIPLWPKLQEKWDSQAPIRLGLLLG